MKYKVIQFMFYNYLLVHEKYLKLYFFQNILQSYEDTCNSSSYFYF